MSQRYRQRGHNGGPVYRPARSEASFGSARRRDVEDDADQARAPRGVRGRYDSTGERGYAAGLERFEEHPNGPLANPRWDLDRGGIEFGRPRGDEPAGQEGPYAGRGPRGYQRSDDRIREDVCDRLTEASDLDASEIDVAVERGIVTLSGTMDGRIAKRRAEDLAATVRGVHDVQNHLSLPAASPTPQQHHKAPETSRATAVDYRGS